MPPKPKFTKDDIITAAVRITRERGISAVTARAIAAELGSSAKPIFGLFAGMDEITREVISYANSVYESYIERGMADSRHSPYKGSGIAYIKFAHDEKELFKLLFMRDRTGESTDQGREGLRPILSEIEKNLGISEDEAFEFHMQMWVYVHGIATMIATSYLSWSEEFTEKSLSDVYQGLKNNLHRASE